MKLEVGEVDEFTAVAARNVLRAFEVRDRVPGGYHLPTVSAVHEE